MRLHTQIFLVGILISLPGLVLAFAGWRVGGFAMVCAGAVLISGSRFLKVKHLQGR